MFAINNIIRSLSRKQEDKLNIVLINSFFDEYIKILTKLDHNFYIIAEAAQHKQWNSVRTIPNLQICSSQWDVSLINVDFIIAFDRGLLYHYASMLSHLWHIPIILVDIASSKVEYPMPIFQPYEKKGPLIMNNGIINISCSKDVQESWSTPWTSEVNYTIHIPPMENKKPSNQHKILIDSNFTKEYLEQISLIIDDRFTTNYEEAAVYLNLWQFYTPLMSNCLENEIPVVTFKENESLLSFKDFCFFIDQNEDPFSVFDKQDFVLKINNGKKFMSDKGLDVFCNKWSLALDYAKNIFYKRGEYAR